MRTAIFICCLFFALPLFPQQPRDLPPALEQQFEQDAERQEEVLEDDLYLQQREMYREHPLDINKAGEQELHELLLLNPIQIKHFLEYRRLLGRLVSVHELQAVPGWDIPLIRKLLPLVTIGSPNDLLMNGSDGWQRGEHSLLVKTSMMLERSQGFLPVIGKERFTGDRLGLFFRYSYNYRNTLQWGCKGDKDPGEPFLDGKGRKGFDFYSCYLFLRNAGFVQALAIGDFTVNFGQGLVQWQSFAFKKSADMNNLKRQSPVLRPYTSSGEFNFHRGLGLTVKRGKWEGTGFVSFRKLSTNLAFDSAANLQYVSSLVTSGYHRTATERAGRNNLSQFVLGGSFKYLATNWHVSAHVVSYRFSKPFSEKTEPYRLFDPVGKSFVNVGLDYGFTHRNLHVFGEAAVDKNGNKAFLNGLLLALDPALDISLVQRSIDRSYRSFNGNALTENTWPMNEKGLYAGISVRPASSLVIDAYKDAFSFPWLRYRVNAPSFGNEYFVRVQYKPTRLVEVYSRFIHERKSSNRAGNNPLHGTEESLRQSWRVQSNMVLSKSLVSGTRWEHSWFRHGPGPLEQGFLCFQDLAYRPGSKPFSVKMRLLYFETSSYNSRVYAFESDGAMGFSIPAYFEKGYQYYLNLHYDLSHFLRSATSGRMKNIKAACWLHFSRTIYPGKVSIGSGLNEISGSEKTELRAQLLIRI